MKSLFLKLAFIFALSILPSFVSADGAQNVSGFAWSSNIGWISFNCTNTSTCGTANYGVHMNAYGWLSGNEASSTPGYAWSSNIGWIQFGGLSGFPTGNGTYAQNAQVVSGSLRGWARALSYGGGWDGWISLSGTSPNYGVTLSGNDFMGYAWGSDVVGWMTFNPSTGNGVVTNGVVDPAAFSLGLDESIRVKLLPNGTSETEQKNVTLGFNGAFETAGNPVTISIQSYPTVASTTFSYSFDGGQNYYTAPSGSLTKTIPKGSSPYYTENVALRIRINRLAGAPSLTSPMVQVVLRGVDSVGGTSDEKTFTIMPVTFDPRYGEF
ncbi:MAG TPA: hypothetical protein VGE35_00380 [Candidatus Paceibacterota bacterium]